MIVTKRRATYIAYRLVAGLLPRSTAIGGRLWKGIRALFARPLLASMGEGVNIERGVSFTPGELHLGSRSGLGVNAFIQGPVSIGRNVMMAPEVAIFTVNHSSADTTRPMRDQGLTPPRPVIIEDDVWIGQRVMIMPGVRVGEGAILAAGAVVTKDVVAYSVVGGNPARFLRSRR